MKDFIVMAGGQPAFMGAPMLSLDALTPMNIAWHLSQINRFNGAALRPYSVAEHSLLVCEIAERELGLDVFGQFAALMHDAHECVATDMHTPGKRAIGPPWQAWEHSWARAIRTAFAMNTAAHVFKAAVDQADLMALATEKRDLMPQAKEAWPVLEGIEPIGWVRLYSEDRRKANWEDWRDRFLDRYHELEFGRNDALYPNPPAPTASGL
jgi:hypothetical protein